jgi:hypothetical protein
MSAAASELKRIVQDLERIIRDLVPAEAPVAKPVSEVGVVFPYKNTHMREHPPGKVMRWDEKTGRWVRVAQAAKRILEWREQGLQANWSTRASQ